MKARLPALFGVALAGVVLASCASDGPDTGNAVDDAVIATENAAGDVADAASNAADEVTSSATWDRIAGNWKQFTGSAKERWGELTDDEVMQVNGNKEQLVGKVQETYGVTRMEAQRQVDDWADGQ